MRTFFLRRRTWRSWTINTRRSRHGLGVATDIDVKLNVRPRDETQNSGIYHSLHAVAKLMSIILKEEPHL